MYVVHQHPLGWRLAEDHPTFAFQAAVNVKQQAYWTQIANTFKDYDEHLLFAGTNEVHAELRHADRREQHRPAVVQPDLRERGARHRRQQRLAHAGRADLQHEHRSRPQILRLADRHDREPAGARSSLLRSLRLHLEPNGACRSWGAPYPDSGATATGRTRPMSMPCSPGQGEVGDQGIPVIIGEYGVSRRPKMTSSRGDITCSTSTWRPRSTGSRLSIGTTAVPPGKDAASHCSIAARVKIVDPGALDAILKGIAQVPPPSK